MSELMDMWHQSAQAYFGVFLEQKFNLFGETVALMSAATGEDLSEKAMMGDGGMSQNRTNFLDAADFAVYSIYKDLPSGFDEGSSEENTDLLYGELTNEGVRQMLKHFKADISGFVDLGSGTGKVAMEVGLLLNNKPEADKPFCQPSDPSAIVQSFGVELLESRHRVAESALKRLAAVADGSTFGVSFAQCSFLNKSALDQLVPAYHSTVSHVFCCGVAYNAGMVESICTEILTAFPQFKEALVLFSKRPSADFFAQFDGVELHDSVAVHTTWMENTPALMLRRL